jgi:hypothetical protein
MMVGTEGVNGNSSGADLKASPLAGHVAFAPIIAVRDPIEISETGRSEFFGAALMRHVPGFELPTRRCSSSALAASGDS